MSDIRPRNRVTVTGPAAGPVLVLSHGFGCDQNMGRLVVPALAHLGWSGAMAPMIMGNPERPELGAELTNSFCTLVMSDATGHCPQLGAPEATAGAIIDFLEGRR